MSPTTSDSKLANHGRHWLLASYSLLLSAALLGCQPEPARDTPAPPEGSGEVASVTLQPGLPDFGPLARKGLGNPMTAAIPSPAAGERIWFVVGQDADGPVYYLLNRHPDQSTYVSKLLMAAAGDDGALEATAHLSFVADSPIAAILKLRLARDGKTLHYEFDAAPISKSWTGLPAPRFLVRSFDGKELLLPQEPGVPLVLNYWATTCAPCVEEIPQLNRIADSYSGRPVRFVALAADTPAAVSRFLAARHFHYEHYLATDQAIGILGNSFPRNIVIAGDGTVLYDRSGFGSRTPEEIVAVLTSATQ